MIDTVLVSVNYKPSSEDASIPVLSARKIYASTGVSTDIELTNGIDDMINIIKDLNIEGFSLMFTDQNPFNNQTEYWFGKSA